MPGPALLRQRVEGDDVALGVGLLEVARVLVGEQRGGGLLLFVRWQREARGGREILIADADTRLWPRQKVLHPVRSIAATREKPHRGAVGSEPALDLLASPPTASRGRDDHVALCRTH